MSDHVYSYRFVKGISYGVDEYEILYKGKPNAAVGTSPRMISDIVNALNSAYANGFEDAANYTLDLVKKGLGG